MNEETLPATRATRCRVSSFVVALWLIEAWIAEGPVRPDVHRLSLAPLYAILHPFLLPRSHLHGFPAS